MTNNKDKKSGDGQIKILQQQKTMVEKQIDNIKNGDMDVRTKQELIEPLQEQIQNIEAQIQQIQVSQISDEDKSKSKMKDQPSSNVSGTDGENKLKLSKDTLILNVSNTYDQLKTINSIKKKLIGNSNVLKSDAHLDEMTDNYSGAKEKRAEAASDLGKANGIQAKIGKMHDNIRESVKETDDLNEKLKYISGDKKDTAYESESGVGKVSSEDLRDGLAENKANIIDEFV